MRLTIIIVALSLAICQAIQVPLTYGVRPFYLVDDMSDSDVKAKLTDCMQQSPQTTDFSIGHRGAALQFPEHTRESYVAGARMGAGVIECKLINFLRFNCAFNSDIRKILTLTAFNNVIILFFRRECSNLQVM